MIFTAGNPSPWSWWETSAWWTRSSLACQGTASCPMVTSSPNFEKRGTKSPPTGRRSYLLLAPRRKNCHPSVPQETHPVQPARRGNLPKSSWRSPWASSPRVPTDSPSRKSLHHGKHSPPSKEQHDKHEKDSHGLSSKCKDKPHSDRNGKDKEGDKSLQKHPMSLPQRPSSTERAGKEPHFEVPSLTLSANSQGCH